MITNRRALLLPLLLCLAALAGGPSASAQPKFGKRDKDDKDRGALTKEDVILYLQRQVPDDVLYRTIDERGLSFPMNLETARELKEAGASAAQLQRITWAAPLDRAQVLSVLKLNGDPHHFFLKATVGGFEVDAAFLRKCREAGASDEVLGAIRLAAAAGRSLSPDQERILVRDALARFRLEDVKADRLDLTDRPEDQRWNDLRWLRLLDVRGLTLSTGHLNAHDFEQLARLPKLEAVWINSGPAPERDRWAAHLARLRALKRLDLGYCAVPEGELVAIAALPALEQLSIRRDRVAAGVAEKMTKANPKLKVVVQP